MPGTTPARLGMTANLLADLRHRGIRWLSDTGVSSRQKAREYGRNARFAAARRPPKGSAAMSSSLNGTASPQSGAGAGLRGGAVGVDVQRPRGSLDDFAGDHH